MQQVVRRRGLKAEIQWDDARCSTPGFAASLQLHFTKHL